MMGGGLFGGRKIDWNRAKGERGVVAVAVVWIAAMFALFGAVQQARDWAQARAQPAQEAPEIPDIFNVSTTDLSEPDYARTAEQFSKLYPSLQIKADSDGLSLTAESVSAFDEWERAVQGVIQSDSRLRWTFKTMCVGSECEDGAYVATLSGERTTFR